MSHYFTITVRPILFWTNHLQCYIDIEMSEHKYSPLSTQEASDSQYLQRGDSEINWPYFADVRRSTYLDYAIEPERRALGEKPRDMWIEMTEPFKPFIGKRIGDIGVGSGYMIDKLMAAGHRGKSEIVGFDTAASHLAALEEILRLHYEHERISLMFGDAADLPLEDNSLDAAAIPFVIYHVDNKKRPRVFSEVHRAVKPDGVTVWSSRGIDNTINMWSLGNKVSEHFGAIMPPPGFFYRPFPLRRLRKTLENDPRYDVTKYVVQKEIIWIPANDEGWGRTREFIFTLLPLMKLPDGRSLTKAEVIDYLENDPQENIRRDYFESLANLYGGHFPDLLHQGFVTATVKK
jgi:ubiquinone/menaquinone biosynthesis C-methylase UbiE